ncbi:MAG: hypothetical protein R6V60_11590 [Desulfobacterales bacterium]
MILKPQDILVLLKLVAIENESWSYSRLAVSLGMSPAEVHAGVGRTLSAQLAILRDGQARPHSRNLEEFLIYGIRYVFVPDRGELTRGMPTGYAANPMAGHFAPSDEPPPVWPVADGAIRGYAFSPLYRSAPRAAHEDVRLYELLVVVDSLRSSSARERKLASAKIQARLKHYAGIGTSQH